MSRHIIIGVRAPGQGDRNDHSYRDSTKHGDRGSAHFMREPGRQTGLGGACWEHHIKSGGVNRTSV